MELGRGERYSFSFGSGFSVKIPNTSPLGGMKIELKLDSVPVTIKSDGDKFQFGFNVGDLVDTKGDDWFSTVKKLNSKNYSKFISAMKNAKTKRTKKLWKNL